MNEFYPNTRNNTANTVKIGFMAHLPTESEVMEHLRNVIDPELGMDIVELGMAKGATVEPDGLVRVTVALTTSGCPLRAQIQRDVRSRIEGLPGVTKVKIDWSELNQEEKRVAMERARKRIAERPDESGLDPTTKVIMVASGKGGVGKSSVTVNLATALANEGFVVGLMDADIWGFSVPRMTGVDGRIAAVEGKMAPNEKVVGQGLLKVISMGFLVEEESSALMWRGLILNRAVQHFIEDVAWGDLDYLLIDMPPGTGDVQMGLAKMLPRSEMIVVTTPSLNAQKVAMRVLDMGRKNFLRIVGVIENMTSFIDDRGVEHRLFGSGGGEALASEAGVPLLGKVPIEAEVADGGDHGRPAVLGSTPAAEELRRITKVLVDEYVPPMELSTCSGQVLRSASRAISRPPSDTPVAIASSKSAVTI